MQNDGPVWAWSGDWELENPVAGDVLPHDGIRISGSAERSQDPDEGIWPDRIRLDGDEPRARYRVTGRIVSATDCFYDMGAGAGLQHSGARVVLSVHEQPMQASVAAHARDLELGTRLTIRGDISLVHYYEWDAFDLVDTRRSWSVEDVRNLEPGYYLVLIRPMAD